MTTSPRRPPMDPDTSEADATQLDLARAEGEAYGRSLDHMVGHVAHGGGVREAGEYLVGYAVEEAEGMYEWRDGELAWHGPGDDNVHVEIAVRDASDGRFVPCLTVHVTLVDPDGNEVGTHEQPLLWHPMIYHYGRNWRVPRDGRYTLRARIEPPTFMRHDEVNGVRFTDVVEVEFTDVDIRRGQD
jgi:Fe2+ transport protein